MTRHTLLALPLLLAACGSTAGPDTAEIQAFNTAAQGVSAAAATYAAQAGTMTSVAACNSAQASYDSQARPLVGQMQGMGGDMDGMMGAMNHMGDADMGCTASAMMAELDRHMGVACAATTDMTPNQIEAEQHVLAMTRWANHAMGRSHDLAEMSGMGMGHMGSGTTGGHCIHAADGSYGLQP